MSFISYIQDHLPLLSSEWPSIAAEDLLSPQAACGIAVVTTVFIALINRLRKSKQYAYLPGPVNKTLFGYMLDMHEETSVETYHNAMCEKYGHVSRLAGGMLGFQADALYVTDPLAMHHILIRHQKNFKESDEFVGLFGIIQHGDGVTSVHDEEHKKHRKLMNPIFTAAFVSRLNNVFYHVAYQLRDKLKARVGNSPNGQVVNILDDLQRAALELIAQGGLGHTFNSFKKNSKEFSEYHEALEHVLVDAGRLFYAMPYFETWRKMRPVWFRRLLAGLVPYLPISAARNFKKHCDVLHPVARDLFWTKKRLLAEGGISELEKMTAGGKDIATLMISANQVAESEDRLSDSSVIADMRQVLPLASFDDCQCELTMIFSSIMLAGQETTSGTLSRLFCILSNDTDLQNRLRGEINDARKAKDGEELTYDELNNLPLLDAVCRETLRVYAPVTFVWRQTVEDCVVPLQFPVRDMKTGAELKEILIKKGTSVYIGLSAANRSVSIWGEDANKYKPKRWLGKMFTETTENAVKLPGIFSNMMTFLGGGRACPGMKFALSELKLMLSVLLPQFSFEGTEKEIEWRMGITVSPFVTGEVSKGPMVPMRVRNLV